MKQMRFTIALAVSACAFAIAAAPALAGDQFYASATGSTKGKTEEEQKFDFGPFHITCLKEISKGMVEEGFSESINIASIKFLKCSTAAHIGSKPIELSTKFTTPIDFEYFAKKYVELGTEEEEGHVNVSSGPIELKVNGGTKFKCTIQILSSKVPTHLKKGEGGNTVEFHNEPTGKFAGMGAARHETTGLFVENMFKGIEVEFIGEPCEEWGREESAELKSGKYEGNFPLELTKGNLEFKEE